MKKIFSILFFVPQLLIAGVIKDIPVGGTGSGGGGGSGGTITASDQNNVAYYSASGATTTLNGSSSFTFNGTTMTVPAVSISSITSKFGNNYVQVEISSTSVSQPFAWGALGGAVAGSGPGIYLYNRGTTGQGLYMFDGSASNLTGFRAPSTLSADGVYTLPNAPGTASQVLSTNGSNVLSWATVAASGASGQGTDTAPSTGTLAAIPATCTVGQRYFATNATAGKNLYTCTATDTWRQLAFDAGSSGGILASCSGNPCTYDIDTAVVPRVSAANTFTGMQTLDNVVQLSTQATPSTPSAGFSKIYANSSGDLTCLNSSGSSCLSSGGVSLSSTNTWTAQQTFNNTTTISSGAVIGTNLASGAAFSMLQVGTNTISSGDAQGTYIGINAPDATRDYLNVQVNGTSYVKFASDGSNTFAGNLTAAAFFPSIFADSLFNINGVTLGGVNSKGMYWANIPQWYGTIDTGITRQSAGIVQINNGTAGTLRDLVARTNYAQAIASTGTIVSISTGTGAATSGSPSASISGGPVAGLLNITTGGSPGTIATVATVQPSVSLPVKIICNLTPANTTTAALSGATSVSVTGSSYTWTVTSGSTGLAATTPYSWNYMCGGY